MKNGQTNLDTSVAKRNLSKMSSKNLDVSFLFSPQASHYVGMGKGLYDAFPCYAEVVEKAESLYVKLTGNSLKASLWEDTFSIDFPDVCGPGIFTLQVGLVQLLRSFGIVPASVLGHSFGEYAAAVCAGVLSFEDGFRLVLGRAQLIKSKVRRGCLTALRANLPTVNDLLTKFHQAHGTPPEIAAVNAPNAVAVGSSFEILSQFESFCFSNGIEFLRLSSSVPFAYHTSDIDPILEGLGTLTSEMTHSSPTMKIISSSTGNEMKGSDFGSEYWKALSRNRIQFSKAILNLCSTETILIEIGPKPMLVGLVRQNFENNPPQHLFALSQEESNSKSLLRCLSQLSCEGIQVNWNPWFQRCIQDEAAQGSVISSEPMQHIVKVLQMVSDEVSLDPLKAEVTVVAASLNYKDKGNFHNRNLGKLGFDFAGIVKRVGSGVTNFAPGEEVYGISLDGGCLASTVTIPQEHLAKIPSRLTPISASTLPLSYLIAWKALVEIGGIGVNDHILVNFGRGWIGIALAHIAHHFGSTVFALSGNNERRKYLESIGITHIYEVPGSDFANLIMKDTKGKGLTVVVNNFEDQSLKDISLKLCSAGGKFVDITPQGHWTPETAHLLRPEVNYSVVDVTSGTEEEMSRMWNSLTTLFGFGSFPPFPHKTFPFDSLTTVFDWFEQGKLGMAKPVICMPPAKL